MWNVCILSYIIDGYKNKNEVIILICPKCSNEIEDDSLFCSSCGSDLRKQVSIADDKYRKDTASRHENEARQVLPSNDTKSSFAKFSLIAAGIACILFFISAEQISKVADDMAHLRSQAGTSLAEIYYQDIGKALKGFAMFARALGVSILAVTIKKS